MHMTLDLYYMISTLKITYSNAGQDLDENLGNVGDVKQGTQLAAVTTVKEATPLNCKYATGKLLA